MLRKLLKMLLEIHSKFSILLLFIKLIKILVRWTLNISVHSKYSKMKKKSVKSTKLLKKSYPIQSVSLDLKHFVCYFTL